jgi:SAM-dependent methyltransferase
VPSLHDQQLVARQYAQAGNLNARIRLHRDFSTNTYGWQRWVFDHLTLPPSARVLELGCGTAALWQENQGRVPAGWEIALADLSRGMLTTARGNLSDTGRDFGWLHADAQALPFPDGGHEAVIANHMLYHVPDLERTLSEMGRVLRPGGRLFAATNGEYHMYEMHPEQLARRYGLVLGIDPIGAVRSFTLENGAEALARHFTNVRLFIYEDSLEISEAQPLVDYMMSMQRADRSQAGALLAAVQRELDERGTIHITKSSGLFEAVKQA